MIINKKNQELVDKAKFNFVDLDDNRVFDQNSFTGKLSMFVSFFKAP